MIEINYFTNMYMYVYIYVYKTISGCVTNAPVRITLVSWKDPQILLCVKSFQIELPNALYSVDWKHLIEAQWIYTYERLYRWMNMLCLLYCERHVCTLIFVLIETVFQIGWFEFEYLRKVITNTVLPCRERYP